MAKYTPIEMVKNYQGKICSHSDTYFQRRGKDKSVLCTGKMCNPRNLELKRGKDKSVLCTGKMCNPRNLELKPYDADELARQAKFAQAAAAVKALTSEQKAAYKAEWLQQDKYQFLSAFIMHKEFEKLV